MKPSSSTRRSSSADAADAAHEVDVLVAPRIGDAEDRAEDLVLADRAVERGHRIVRVEACPARTRARYQRPPEVDAERLGRRGVAAAPVAARLDVEHLARARASSASAAAALRDRGRRGCRPGSASGRAGRRRRGRRRARRRRPRSFWWTRAAAALAVVAVGDVERRARARKSSAMRRRRLAAEHPEPVLDAVGGGEVVHRAAPLIASATSASIAASAR